MTLKDLTIDDIQAAARRALEALEGTNLYTPGPWPITVRPFADPPTVIYQAADGATYERPMTLDIDGDSLTCRLGDRREVESRTVWVPIEAAMQPEFSAAAGFAGKTRKSGLIFRAGKYPDKGVEVTADDIRQFVANFPAEGVLLMSEHEDSLIGEAMREDGAKLLRVWSENGDSELHGEVEYPNWLAYGLRKLRNTVSVGLDLAAKTLRELSLVKFPRVADAEVFRREAAVAFSRTPVFPSFAAKHPSEAALIVEAAKSAPAPANTMDKKTIIQRAKQFLFGLPSDQRGGLTDEELKAAFDDPPGNPVLNVTIDPALRAEIDALKGEVHKERTEFAAERAAQRDADDAAKFYLEQLRAGRAGPTDEADVLAEFADARFRDRHTTANFNADQPGQAEKALRDRYSKRPIKFQLGGGHLDSTLQPRIDGDSPLGIFAADFKKREDK